MTDSESELDLDLESEAEVETESEVGGEERSASSGVSGSSGAEWSDNPWEMRDHTGRILRQFKTKENNTIETESSDRIAADLGWNHTTQ